MRWMAALKLADTGRRAAQALYIVTCNLYPQTRNHKGDQITLALFVIMGLMISRLVGLAETSEICFERWIGSA
jgi:hypothetical protein